METDKIINEYESKVDSSRRITLRKGKNLPIYDHYKTIHLEDGTIIHKPLILVPPEAVVSPETLAAIEESVSNVKTKKVGASFQADQFQDLLDEDGDED